MRHPSRSRSWGCKVNATAGEADSLTCFRSRLGERFLILLQGDVLS